MRIDDEIILNKHYSWKNKMNNHNTNIKTDIDDMSKKVRSWLSEEGIYKDRVADNNAHFHYIGEIPSGSGRLFDVFQPKNRDDLIIVANGFVFPPQHLKNLRDMDDARREEFIWDIRFGLLFRESGFNMLPDIKNPERVDFIREIHYDGLNKNKLMESIRENFRCNLFIIWKLNKQFGELVPRSDSIESPMFG